MQEHAFLEGVQDCPLPILMLVSRLLLALVTSQEKRWWPKGEPGPAGLGLSSLGLYDICPSVYKTPVRVSI